MVAAPVTAPVAPPAAAPIAAPRPPPTAPPIAAPAPAPSRPPPTARCPGSYGFVHPANANNIPAAIAPGAIKRFIISPFQNARDTPAVCGTTRRGHRLFPASGVEQSPAAIRFDPQVQTSQGEIMKATFAALAAVVLTGAFYIQPVEARPLPHGSYLGSCSHIVMQGPRLSADCRRRDGSWRRTVLDVRRCSGDIGNRNGHLTCNFGSHDGYGGGWRGR